MELANGQVQSSIDTVHSRGNYLYCDQLSLRAIVIDLMLQSSIKPV